MADIGTFRSALNGFNRQDVANYIAYLNNKHTSEVEQLNNRLQSALNRQQTERDLEQRLSQAEARCAELEAELAGRRAAPAETHTDSELEAYRRAERTEREAKAPPSSWKAAGRPLWTRATRFRKPCRHFTRSDPMTKSGAASKRQPCFVRNFS